MTRILLLLICLLLLTPGSQACYILFLSNGQQVMVANHEDWFARDAAMKINPPTSNRYGSVTFTFLSEGWAQGGMNEHGLFFDAAYTPFQEVTFEDATDNPTFYLWQRLLDKCKNVDEALRLIKKYKIPELAEAHIMVADATGHAVIVGVDHGRLAIKPFENHYLLQTNFNPWQPELSDEQDFWRYQKTREELSTNNEVSLEHLRNILEQTRQDSLTAYSNIYDLKNKTIVTYNKGHFEKPIAISLPQLFDHGECMMPIDVLETNASAWENCDQLGIRSTTLTGKVTNQKTGEPVPYANIGLVDRNIGTLSDPDGSFEIVIPNAYLEESLMCSSIGYETSEIRLSQLNSSSPYHSVVMKPSVTVLKEIIVKPKGRLKVDRLGWMGGKDGVLPLDTIQGGGTVAMLLQAEEVPAFVSKLQVRLMYNSKDTLTLRLHFYDYDSTTGAPGKELLDHEILLTETKRYGWLRFDLSDENIVITSQPFFVGFEWIEDRHKRKEMVAGLREWHNWKREQHEGGNSRVEAIPTGEGKVQYKYHGNMMDWPGFKQLPPFTGLMVMTGKTRKTEKFRTFERKTSFGPWIELNSTLNAVVTVAY